MDNENLYIINPGEGLKLHLSLDSDGVQTFCGQKIKLSTKSVRKFEPGPFGFGSLYMTDLYCKKCLKQVGINAE